MKTWRVIGTLFAVLSWACGASVSSAASASPPPVSSALPEPSGGAYVATLPSGADLWLDGVHVGRTPILLGGVYRGRHRLTLAKSGWVTQDVPLLVSPQVVVWKYRELVRSQAAGVAPQGAVNFHPVAGSHLRVDGAPVPSDGQALALAAGAHVVEVTTPSTSFERAFTVLPEMTSDLILEPRPMLHAAVVVAATQTELPQSVVTVERDKIVLRYHQHVLVGHVGDPLLRIDGRTIHCDPAPVVLAGRVYLPVEILAQLRDSGPLR